MKYNRTCHQRNHNVPLMQPWMQWLKAATVLSLCVAGGISGCASGRRGSQTNFDLAPDGNTIVFTASGNEGRNDLYLLDLTTRGVTQITSSPDDEITPAFSHDGNHIVYAASPPLELAPARLYTIARDRPGDRKQLTRENDNNICDMSPSYDAKNRRIVFARSALQRPYSMGGHVWDHWDVFTVTPNGTGLRRITNRAYRAVDSPTFLSGSHILYAAQIVQEDYSTKYGLYRTPDAGEPPVEIDEELKVTSPSLSQNRASLAFISDKQAEFNYEVWTADSNAENKHQLTRSGSYNTNPRFSPDGKFIYYLSDPTRQDEWELWRVNVDGSTPVRIADSHLFSDPQHWKP